MSKRWIATAAAVVLLSGVVAVAADPIELNRAGAGVNGGIKAQADDRPVGIEIEFDKPDVQRRPQPKRGQIPGKFRTRMQGDYLTTQQGDCEPPGMLDRLAALLGGNDIKLECGENPSR